MKKAKRKLLERNQSATTIKSLFDNRDGTYTVLVEKLDYDLNLINVIESKYTLFGEALNHFRDWSSHGMPASPIF